MCLKKCLVSAVDHFSNKICISICKKLIAPSFEVVGNFKVVTLAAQMALSSVISVIFAKTDITVFLMKLCLILQ